MNAKTAFMVAIAMLLVTTQKAPIIVPVNQDFMETAKTAVKVSKNNWLQFTLILK